MSEQQADLALAIDAARRAGAVVMRYFGRDMVVEHKTPDQPLTEADLAANAVLHEVLIGARPDYGWLSEESATYVSPAANPVVIDRTSVGISASRVLSSRPNPATCSSGQTVSKVTNR